MLSFEPVTKDQAGIIASLLMQSYAGILSSGQLCWQQEKEKWQQFDREVFANPDTIGRCVFLTCLEGTAIGFGSFDPRRQPEYGVIGHNCIVPELRGHGYGRKQIDEILERFRQMGIRRALVTTGEHPFFVPAQKMYLACGFTEIRRFAGGPDPDYGLIEYNRDL